MYKAELGKFYTTNHKYILSNMKIPKQTKSIIEPFVGNGDLLNFIKNKDKYDIEIYDIDSDFPNVIKRDTLKNPPDYSNKFILTNPPYLARNKSKGKNKDLYDRYSCNDLYKCFIKNIIENVSEGGIIIVPLNFISSIRKSDIELRRKFLEKYSINIINIFEEQVFDDTSYTICSILFSSVRSKVDPNIKVYIYPSKKCFTTILEEKNNYTIGGEIYNLPQNPNYRIERATKKTKTNITNILLKCIDDSSSSKLGFKIVDDDNKFIDNTKNLTERSYASLVITVSEGTSLTLSEQKKLVDKMNQYLENHRNKYHSLFLSNYRESNTIARKRISFDLAYKICNYNYNLLESSNIF